MNAPNRLRCTFVFSEPHSGAAFSDLNLISVAQRNGILLKFFAVHQSAVRTVQVDNAHLAINKRYAAVPSTDVAITSDANVARLV